MEKRINNKIDNWVNQFKDDVRDYIITHKSKITECSDDTEVERLISHIYNTASLGFRPEETVGLINN